MENNINNINQNEQNENLLPLKESSRWQLTEPYNSKKHSVLVFLIQIFYIVSIFTLMLLGFYFLFQPSSSTFHTLLLEKENKWNQSLMNTFQNTKFIIQGEQNKVSLNLIKYQHNIIDTNKKAYVSLSYTSNEIGKLISDNNTELQSFDITKQSYNITVKSIMLYINNTMIKLTDIDLIIKSRTNYTKSQCDNNNGLFNGESDICYQFFFIKTICLVVHNNTLYNNYKRFKCNNFTPWYQSFKLVQWKFPDSSPTIQDILNSGTIDIFIYTIDDPGIFLSYFDESEIDDDNKVVNSLWFFVIAVGLIVVGLVFYFNEHHERENERVGSMRKQIQMGEKKESSDEEEEKKVRVPNPLLK